MSPDTNFFGDAKAQKLSDLATAVGAKLREQPNDVLISGVAQINEAQAGEITFFENKKYLDYVKDTSASACIISEKYAKNLPKDVIAVISDTPYKSYARIAALLYPEKRPDNAVSDKAIIADTAKIGENAWIEHGAIIGENVQIGDDCRIGAGAIISHAIIGNNTRIYPNACIGQDGFGFAIDPNGHVKVPQLGRVIIGNNVEIGANTTIDRGALSDTTIGDGTWIDNLVQIGHNVQIGRGCIIVAQCGIAGSTTIGDFVALGGQAGIAGHLKIGSGARIGAKSGIMRDIPDGAADYMGSPALPIREFMRQLAVLSKLTKKGKRK